VGLVLLAATLIFDLALLEPSYARIDTLHEEIAQAEAQAKHPARVADRATLAEQQLNHYYSYFPPQNSAPDWLGKIFQAADTQTLQLVQGEYRVKRTETGKLVHYHIAMPVKGTYTQIRHFIAAVLASVPAVSLDHVSFERQKIEDPILTAKVTFTLYMVTS